MALHPETARHLQKVLENNQATEVNFLLPDHNVVTTTKIVEVDGLRNQVVCKGSLFIYRGGGKYEQQSGTQYVSLEQVRNANHNGGKE